MYRGFDFVLNKDSIVKSNTTKKNYLSEPVNYLSEKEQKEKHSLSLQTLICELFKSL